MYLSLFFKGLGTGIMMTAALGPLAILCIRQTLAHGQIVGLAIGLGTALGDVIYGLITALSLTLISNFILTHEALFRLLGGIFLILFGLKTFFEKQSQQSPIINSKNLISMMLSTLFLNLSNPITLVSCTAILTGLSVETENIASTGLALLLLGIFLGALIWNIILTSILKLFRTKITPATLHIINKCSGAFIIGVGLLSLISLLI